MTFRWPTISSKGLAVLLGFPCVGGCMVYDAGLLAEGDASASGGQTTTMQSPTFGTGGTGTEPTSMGGTNVSSGGTSSGGAASGGTIGSGGSPTEQTCDWSRGAPILSTEPVDVVDDFNDGDNLIPKKNGRDGAWFSLNDGSGGTQFPANGGWQGLVMQPVGTSETDRALHYRAYGFTGSGNGDGWHLFGTALAGAGPYDLSGFQGLTFWVRADCATSGSVQTGLRVAISDGVSEGTAGAIDHAGSVVPVQFDNTWRQIKLPFDAFVRRFGSSAKLVQTDAMALYFSSASEGQLDIWIDDVAFYSDQ